LNEKALESLEIFRTSGAGTLWFGILKSIWPVSDLVLAIAAGFLRKISRHGDQQK